MAAGEKNWSECTVSPPFMELLCYSLIQIQCNVTNKWRRSGGTFECGAELCFIVSLCPLMTLHVPFMVTTHNNRRYNFGTHTTHYTLTMKRKSYKKLNYYNDVTQQLVLDINFYIPRTCDGNKDHAILEREPAL